MTAYPDLSNITSGTGINGILALPNASYPWFWTIIMAGIWIILSTTLYFREKTVTGRGNLLSSMAVGALACEVLTVPALLIGTFTVTTGVPILVFGALIIAIWVFS